MHISIDPWSVLFFSIRLGTRVEDEKNNNFPVGKTIEVYPNPFNALTTIRYNLLSASNVRIDIYDILGCKVETLIDKQQPTGYHRVIWDAGDYSSGVYFYKFQAGDFSESRKMILLK